MSLQNNKMVFVDKKNIPSFLSEQEQKKFREEHRKVIDMLEEKKRKKKELNLMSLELLVRFRDFWELCDNPIPVCYTKLIRWKVHYFITRNNEKIKVVKGLPIKEKAEMVFVETKEIPKKTVGKQSKDWRSTLDKIPEGKAWKIAKDSKEYKISSIKSAIKKINKEAKEELFIAVQRTENGEVFLYVTKA